MSSGLQANDFLWPRLRPRLSPLSFRAQGARAATRWRMQTRPQLEQVLGFQDVVRGRPAARLLERTELKDLVREKHLLQTSKHSRMPVYLLLPKGIDRPPVVIAYHGHGYGARDVVGLGKDGRARVGAPGYHRDFALALCRLGFAVAVPEIACFGERVNRDRERAAAAPVPSSCQQSSALAMHLGGTVLGIRVMEARQLVGWLTRLPHLDSRRLGTMGISGGGVLGLMHAALDERVRAAVVSGYLCDWRDSLFGVRHCSCNIVPGLGRFGTVSDIAGLVAPRPLLIEAGDRDVLFPIAGVRRAAARAGTIYARSGAAGAFTLAEFRGSHRIDGTRAYPFLIESLSSRS